jgi:thioredoxin reductase (NADPH)
MLDCAIVGGGAAGLTAAIYLARYHRWVRVIDADASRLRAIPRSHNYPGHAAGIPGSEILARMREQARHYGVPSSLTAVERIERLPGGGFLVVATDAAWRARTVILATGVVDVAPAFPFVQQALARGCLRYCPVCDGYEATGKRVVVLGRGNSGIGEALFVRHFATEVILCTVEEAIRPDAEQSRQLEAAGVRLVQAPLRSAELEGDCGMRLELRDGSVLHADVVYAALGTLVNSGLAQALGAKANDSGELFVDAHQQTSVDGLYAAGDLVHGLNQITVAMGHAAIAATAIHNRLREARLLSQ